MPNTSIPSLVEVVQAPEIYCSELSWVEATGPNVRFFLTVKGSSALLGEQKMSQVVLRVIMPLEAVVPAVELTLRRLALQSALRILRVVK
jgi:hypothetical protein